MQEPPRDRDGSVTPHDHAEILNDHEVIRRISEKQLVRDSDGKLSISSIAYKASTGKNGGMSIDLKYQIEQTGLVSKEYVTTPRWIGSVLLKVSDIRQLGFQVGYDPLLLPEPNPYHGEVWGNFSKGETGTIKKLQKLSVWFVQIDGVSL